MLRKTYLFLPTSLKSRQLICTEIRIEREGEKGEERKGGEGLGGENRFGFCTSFCLSSHHF